MKNSQRPGSKLVRLNIAVAEDIEAETLRHPDGRKMSMSDKCKVFHEVWRHQAMKGQLNIEMRPAISIVRDNLGESASISLMQMVSALQKACKFRDPNVRDTFLEKIEETATRLAMEALDIRIVDEGIVEHLDEVPIGEQLELDLEVASLVKKRGKP